MFLPACSVNLLHTKRVIEQTPCTRRVMALALAEQFFGCYVGMSTWLVSEPANDVTTQMIAQQLIATLLLRRLAQIRTENLYILCTLSIM